MSKTSAKHLKSVESFGKKNNRKLYTSKTI